MPVPSGPPKGEGRRPAEISKPGVRELTPGAIVFRSAASFTSSSRMRSRRYGARLGFVAVRLRPGDPRRYANDPARPYAYDPAIRDATPTIRHGRTPTTRAIRGATPTTRRGRTLRSGRSAALRQRPGAAVRHDASDPRRYANDPARPYAQDASDPRRYANDPARPYARTRAIRDATPMTGAAVCAGRERSAALPTTRRGRAQDAAIRGAPTTRRAMRRTRAIRGCQRPGAAVCAGRERSATLCQRPGAAVCAGRERSAALCQRPARPYAYDPGAIRGATPTTRRGRSAYDLGDPRRYANDPHGRTRMTQRSAALRLGSDRSAEPVGQ